MPLSIVRRYYTQWSYSATPLLLYLIFRNYSYVYVELSLQWCKYIIAIAYLIFKAEIMNVVYTRNSVLSKITGMLVS